MRTTGPWYIVVQTVFFEMSLFSSILKGLLGDRLYRLGRILIFGPQNDALDKATPMGAAEAEEQLRENDGHIAEIRQAIASTQAQKEEIEGQLGDLQNKLKAARCQLDAALQRNLGESEILFAGEVVAQFESSVRAVEQVIATVSTTLQEEERALIEAQRQQTRLKQAKELADLKAKLASSMENMQAQQDGPKSDVVKRYIDGANLRLGTAKEVRRLASQAPDNAMQGFERQASAASAIEEARQRLGLPPADGQPLSLEPERQKEHQ